ncbi:MAG: hypothetical protein F6K00_34930 [Leptolyngbya sp. SIOISBB]|nr:hypothetical protein [Leptolyngbya sp. SIOISBB]
MKLDFDGFDTTPQTSPKALISDDVIGAIKIGFFGIVIVGIFGVGIFQAFSPQARQIRSEIRRQDQQQVRDLTLQQQQQRHSQQERKIAEERYQDGCHLVYARDEEDNVVSLHEGMKVVDSSTNQPLAEGVTVCDPNGATAVLETGGIVGVIAVTPNSDLVRQTTGMK